MKNVSLAFICFLTFTSIIVAADVSFKKQPAAIKQATAERLRGKLADKIHEKIVPPLDTFIVEDNLGQQILISEIPARVLNEGEEWIKRLVRSEWLPTDMRKEMQARKDVLIQEWHQPGNSGDHFQEVGDFLILDYEIKDHRILLLESGKTLTARIQLPKETDITRVAAKDILKLVSTFFTLPETAIYPDDIKIEGDDQVRSFRWITGPTQEEVSKRFITGESLNWWFSLQLHFDGQTLLISIPEIDNPPRLSPRITLQDRF